MKLLWLAAILAFAQSRDPAVLSDAAREYARLKQYDEAERFWNRALEIAPDHFPALYQMGSMFLARKLYDKAEPLLARASAVNPNDFNAHHLHGEALVQLGRSEDALRQWQKALDLDPSSLRLMQAMIAEFTKGRYFEEAARVARRAIRRKPDAPTLYATALQALVNARHESEALELARDAVRQFPAPALRNAMDIASADAPSRRILARALSGLGKSDEAKAVLDDAARVERETPSAARPEGRPFPPR